MDKTTHMSKNGGQLVMHDNHLLSIEPMQTQIHTYTHTHAHTHTHTQTTHTPNLENPSCLQATLASLVDHRPSQTVPQVSFQQISTRPCLGTALPTSLMSPLSQTPVDKYTKPSRCALKSELFPHLK